MKSHRAFPWRRPRSLLAAALLPAFLAACAPSVAETGAAPGAPGSARAQAHPACLADDFVVSIPDPALRSALASQVGAPGGSGAELRCSDLARVTNLRARGVESLAGVEHAVNLSTLALRDSPVTSLAPLEGLTRLQSITLHGGRLSSLEPAARMPALVALDVMNSSVTDISPLANVPGLAYLKADGNEIADISALAGLTELTRVDLSGNRITDVSAFGGGHPVETLLLNDNLIRDASPLGAASRLQRVELANNALTDLEFLRTIEPRSVNLAGNMITSVNAVAHNRYIDGSRRVDLRNNCIDLTSDDPFVRDVMDTGGAILLEPQRDDCAL